MRASAASSVGPVSLLSRHASTPWSPKDEPPPSRVSSSGVTAPTPADVCPPSTLTMAGLTEELMRQLQALLQPQTACLELPTSTVHQINTEMAKGVVLPYEPWRGGASLLDRVHSRRPRRCDGDFRRRRPDIPDVRRAASSTTSGARGWCMRGVAPGARLDLGRHRRGRSRRASHFARAGA